MFVVTSWDVVGPLMVLCVYMTLHKLRHLHNGCNGVYWTKDTQLNGVLDVVGLPLHQIYSCINNYE